MWFDAGKVPEPIQVAKALKGKDFKPRYKTRGIQLAGNVPEATLLEPAPAPHVLEDVRLAPTASPSDTALAVAIPFAFNSAALKPDAHESLDNIAEGIKLISGDNAVVIEGHTDAKGNDAYNQRLSYRRALSVKRYLVKQHGLNTSQLKAVGKGRSEPLNTADPFASENRRVQFRLG